MSDTPGTAKPSSTAVLAATLGAVVLMGICFPAIETGLPYAPPLLFAGLRLLLGGTALLMVAWFTGRPVWPEPRLAQWILPLGMIATALTYAFMFASPSFTTAGVASILGNTQPLFLAVFGMLVLGERLSVIKVVSFVIAFAGVVLIASVQFSSSTEIDFTGIFLALGSALFAALASIWMKALRPGRALLALTGCQLLVGGLVLFVAFFVLEEAGPVHFDLRFVMILLALSLGSTAAATFFWYWALQHAEAWKLGRFLFLVPVIGVVLSVLWVGEKLQLLEIAGMALIVFSLIFLRDGKSGPRKGGVFAAERRNA